MRKIYCCLLFVIPHIVFAQEKIPERPLILKLNIPSFGDETTFPTLSLSAEKKTGAKTSILVEAGYQLYTIQDFVDTTFTKPRGIKLGAEFRYYPGHTSGSDMTGFYMAANIFFRENKYTENLSYYPKDQPVKRYDNYLVDNFVVKKSIAGVNLVAGKQINFKVPLHKEKRKKVFPNIFMDGSVGIGAFYRKVKNEQREFSENIHERYTSRHPNFYDALTKSGLSENSGLKPSFAFNFRVGYRL
ncbi:MAG: hypothetical protein QM594_04320 [Niabella sp.]